MGATTMYVITLTTIPPRFAGLGAVLESLLAQRPRPFRICLCLPDRYARFPGAHARPAVPAGVEIHRANRDLGPATKVLPLARALRGQDIDLIYCDDDCLYRPGWAQALLAARPNKGTAVAASGFGIERLRRRPSALPGDADIAQGFGGVLVRPEMFDAAAQEIPDALQAVDDIWLSGHLARRGIPIRLSPAARRLCRPRAGAPAALQKAMPGGRSRAQLNAECAAHFHQRYGIWPPH